MQTAREPPRIAVTPLARTPAMDMRGGEIRTFQINRHGPDNCGFHLMWAERRDRAKLFHLDYITPHEAVVFDLEGS